MVRAADRRAIGASIYPSGLRVAYDLDPATKEAVRVRDVAGGAPFADQVTRLPGGPVTSLSFNEIPDPE